VSGSHSIVCEFVFKKIVPDDLNLKRTVYILKRPSNTPRSHLKLPCSPRVRREKACRREDSEFDHQELVAYRANADAVF